ncbi:hypothetical protein HDU81_005288 [Chytriomyces hyalinus]|nr:hypothetical protein HDU81_005288 [Chytriomyces hyalinus]
MSQVPAAAKPLSIGAYRFVGNISMGTSVSDILAHVGEVLDAAEAMLQLRRNCLSSGRTGGEVVDIVIKAMSGDVCVETDVSVHLSGEGPSELPTQVSGGPMNREKTASPFLPFVNKVKTSLLEEKGLYKKFLDCLTDFRQLRTTNLKTLASVFQLFHRHKQLLSEFCHHVLQVSTIPTAYFMPRAAHLERFKIPTKPHTSELARNQHFETLRQGPALAATALSVFDPNGTHSVHLSMTSRMRKPNLCVKTLKTARNNSSASSRNLDGPMSAPLPQRPQRRKDSNASLSSNPPGSTCSSGNESGNGSGSSNSEATVPKAFPRRVTRASHGQSSFTGSPVAPLVPETAFKPVTRQTRSTPLSVKLGGAVPDSDALNPRSPCVPKKPSSPCISQRSATMKLPAPTIQRDQTPIPTVVKSLKRTSSSASSSSATSLELEKVVSKRSKTTPKPQPAAAPMIQKPPTAELRVTSKSKQEPTKPTLETSTLTPYALATRLFEPSIPLPSAPNSSDPPMQKMDRNSIEYIMNAMLNHQCATLFRDPSSDMKSTNTSRRTSGVNSPPSTITDTASTISMDFAGGAQTEAGGEMKSASRSKLFNLNRMSERLKAGMYSSHAAFKRDFDGMMANFRERNAFVKKFEEVGKMQYGSASEHIKFSEFEKEELDFELVAAERLERYFANEWTHFFPAITGKRSRGGKGGNDGASPFETVGKNSRR